MTAVIIALVAGVLAGAFVVWLVTRGQGQGNPAVMRSQGEIKARLDEALAQVQHLGAIFANAGQLGRAGPGAHLPEAGAIPAQTGPLPLAPGLAGSDPPDNEAGRPAVRNPNLDLICR